jgi:hypothetical protein
VDRVLYKTLWFTRNPFNFVGFRMSMNKLWITEVSVFKISDGSVRSLNNRNRTEFRLSAHPVQTAVPCILCQNAYR